MDSNTSLFALQYDPFAEHRPQKIIEREDEYKARRIRMIISPERLDPFADGKFSSHFFVVITTSPFPPTFLTAHFFSGTPSPHDCQWFFTLIVFAVEPFDHNAIACLPDSMPSLWSILCGPRTSFFLFSVFLLIICLQLLRRGSLLLPCLVQGGCHRPDFYPGS